MADSCGLRNLANQATRPRENGEKLKDIEGSYINIEYITGPD